MKIKLLEDTEILKGLTKPAGSILSGIEDAKALSWISEGKAERLQKAGLPNDYPYRERLMESGYTSEKIVNKVSDKILLDINGIGPKTLTEIRKYKPHQNED